MITNQHIIELYLDDNLVDISDENINITFQNIIYDPTKINNTSTTYSYSFGLPKTNKNIQIFDFANILSKLNKFNKRYNAKLYSDGKLLFTGLCKLTEITNDEFKVNLFIPKQNTLETIFGDSVMSDITWEVDFKGVETLNTVNYDMSTKYFFPLVAYSLFQKQPKTLMGNQPVFSSKTQIDGQNRFYYNSIIPSLNLVEVVKRCFDFKGYTLAGDILTDSVLNNIYMSNYISDNQDPLYNYGLPKLGSVTLQFGCKNKMINDRGSGWTYLPGNEYYFQYPPEEYAVRNNLNNFDHINWLNVLDVCESYDSPERDGFGYFISKNNDSKMYSNGFISIPANGYYRIRFSAIYGINPSQTAISRVLQYNDNGETVETTKQKNATDMPIEFHLCRFSGDDGSENNLRFELIKRGVYPNEAEAVANPNADIGISDTGDTENFNYTYTNYTNESGQTLNTTAVDPLPNPDFICGLSRTQWSNANAYIKNGKSWSVESDEFNEALYNCPGYYLRKSNKYTSTVVYSPTDWNKNEIANATDNSSTQCDIIVKLNKNDMIGLYMLYRVFDLSQNQRPYSDTYAIDLSLGTLSVEAIAVENTPIKNITDFNMTSNFGKKLNLGNFLNNEEKMSDFINNVIKTFNLSFMQNDNVISLNKQKINTSFYNEPINIDNRANQNDDVTIKTLDLPKSVEVKFKIDTEERGFYLTVPEDKLELNDWTSYGDYGSDKVILQTIEDTNDLTQDLNFSYNYFETFKIYDFVRLKNNQTASTTIKIPIIAKDEWFIENYKYQEMMKYDGRGFTQRFWFRQMPLQDTASFNYKIPINVYYKEADINNYYQICLPTNTKTINGKDVDLNFKYTNDSLLNYYFNIDLDSSMDCIEVQCYINTEEYLDIQNGRYIKYNDDLYMCFEINKFDPTNISPTILKLIKLK